MGKKHRNNKKARAAAASPQQQQQQQPQLLQHLCSDSIAMRLTACIHVAESLRTLERPPALLVRPDTVAILVRIASTDTDLSVVGAATGALRNLPLECGALNNEAHLVALAQTLSTHRLSAPVVADNILMLMVHLCEYYNSVVMWISQNAEQWLQLLLTERVDYASASLLHVLTEGNPVFAQHLHERLPFIISQITITTVPVIAALLCGVVCNFNDMTNNDALLGTIMPVLCSLLQPQQQQVPPSPLSNDSESKETEQSSSPPPYEIALQIIGNLFLEPTPALFHICSEHNLLAAVNQLVAPTAAMGNCLALECLNNMVMAAATASTDGRPPFTDEQMHGLSEPLIQCMLAPNVEDDVLNATTLTLWSLSRVSAAGGGYCWQWNGPQLQRLVQLCRQGSDGVRIYTTGIIGCVARCIPQHTFVLRTELQSILKREQTCVHVLNEAVSALIELYTTTTSNSRSGDNDNERRQIMEALKSVGTRLQTMNGADMDMLRAFLQYDHSNSIQSS